ncbi:hypothetical protein ACIBQX_37350 [Nonomuraea sp. NPDC049714]
MRGIVSAPGDLVSDGITLPLLAPGVSPRAARRSPIRYDTAR